MCLLILIRPGRPGEPLLLASNRDEARDRKAAPPGLFVGRRRRMLSPRDRLAGGTWLAVNDLGMVAALTNVAGLAGAAATTTRGELPHVALDTDTVDAAVEAVTARCAATPFDAFQLLIADARQTAVVTHWLDHDAVTRVEDPLVVLSNEHRLGELTLPGVAAAQAEDLGVPARLDLLARLLRDDGSAGGHRILKRGGNHGTVSSSLLAVPAGGRLAKDGTPWIWRYAAGPPDTHPYREYGNLARRLVQAPGA